MGGLVFPMLAGREGMRLYWERYPAAPDDIHAAHGRYSAATRLNDIRAVGADVVR